MTEAMDITRTVNPDLILIDDWHTPANISKFISQIKNISESTPVIVIRDENSKTLSDAEFIKAGAYDCVLGTENDSQLQQIVNRIENKSETADSQSGLNQFFSEDYAVSVSMAGRSRATIDSLKMIKLVANSRCNPVLIVGETGTGKELAAMAIHAIRHPHEPFVAVNCAALTANLLESELFGHVKGSFTGADREKIGLLELAGAGTIFLDEISEMPLDLQAKLLRVLQEKNFRKVGGTKNITSKATIIASSNRDLFKEVQTNKFRRDLYYRLSICPICIAPLRSPERRDDIQLLAEYFLRTSTICPEKVNKITSLTKLAVEALEKHPWPGNVRELSNVIERAILLETTDKIGLSSIVINPTQINEQGSNVAANQIREFSLEKAERELISRALQETGWQKTRAAALLGITRATLYAKVKQYNIEKDSNILQEGLSDTSSRLPTQTVSVP